MRIMSKISMRNLLVSTIFAFFLTAHMAAFSAVSAVTTVDGPPLVAIGSANLVKSDNADILTVNGQQIVFDNQTVIFANRSNLDDIASSVDKESLRDGDYLFVFGELVQSGILLATDVYVSDEEYIAGVSRTYMRAVVDRTATSAGIAYSGNSVIDYSAALYSDELYPLKNGNVIEVQGTAYDSNFYADSGRIVGINELDSDSLIFESSVLGQRGSGIRGQRGSGIRGQRGSGIRGQRGSGIR